MGVLTGHPRLGGGRPRLGSVDNRAEVREFLMSRRAKVTPADAGLAAGANRRVAGLRRTEVALLAGVSVEYYAKLERGAIAGASASVLEAIAEALQLDDTERAHLLDLARAADGIPTSGRARRRATRVSVSRPSLAWALEAITDGVAFVRNQQQDLLATNALGRVFYQPLIGDGGRTPNLARFQFLDPASREFYPDWDLFAQMCVDVMRAEAGRDPHDRGLQDLVGELSTRSETFRRLWGAHNVRTHGTGTNGSTTRMSVNSSWPTKNSRSPPSPVWSCSSTPPNPARHRPNVCGCWHPSPQSTAHPPPSSTEVGDDPQP